MVYYEDKGLLNFVHFILSGQCTILQCLKVQVSSGSVEVKHLRFRCIVPPVFQAKRVEKNEKRYTLSNLVLKKSDSHEIMEQINQAAKDYYTRTQSGGVANEIRRLVPVTMKQQIVTRSYIIQVRSGTCVSTVSPCPIKEGISSNINQHTSRGIV